MSTDDPWHRDPTRVPATSIRIFAEIHGHSGWRIYHDEELARRFIERHAKSHSVLGDERFSDETRDVLHFTADDGEVEFYTAVFINGAVTEIVSPQGTRLSLAIRESDAQRYGYPDEGYERAKKKDE